MSEGTESEVRTARFDKRAAFLTFDALERQVVAAVAHDEMEVAAEVAEALFLLQSELGEEWLNEYHSISSEFEVEEEIIGDAMEAVGAWAKANDDVWEWFE